MDSGMRTIYPHSSNKGFSLKFPVGHPDQHTPDDGWRAQRSKHCDNNSKDEDNSLPVNNVNKRIVIYF